MKSERKALDERPGAVPEIRADGDSVIFYLDVPAEHARLIIRCNPDGTIRPRSLVVGPWNFQMTMILRGGGVRRSAILLGGRSLVATPSQYDAVSVVLPAGDPQAGRRAFVDLKCTVCHRVEGEARFPRR